MEEGIFPGYRAVMFGGEKEIEEERRLCYVGITRAKEVLYMTHAKSRMQHGLTQYNPPSRFLKEILRIWWICLLVRCPIWQRNTQCGKA